MKRLIILNVVLLLTVGIGYPSLAAAEEDLAFPIPAEQDEITGDIESINYDDSMVTIKYYTDEAMVNYRRDDFYVRQEAVIEKDGQKISFRDLFPGEHITVHFRADEDGVNEITHIWVKQP